MPGRRRIAAKLTHDEPTAPCEPYAFNKLPTEILSLVIEAGLGDGFDQRLPHYFLMKATQVNHHWREVALQNADLWASFWLDLTSQITPSRERLIELWLSRSKGRPLFIQLNYTTHPFLAQYWTRHFKRLIFPFLSPSRRLKVYVLNCTSSFALDELCNPRWDGKVDVKMSPSTESPQMATGPKIDIVSLNMGICSFSEISHLFPVIRGSCSDILSLSLKENRERDWWPSHNGVGSLILPNLRSLELEIFRLAFPLKSIAAPAVQHVKLKSDKPQSGDDPLPLYPYPQTRTLELGGKLFDEQTIADIVATLPNLKQLSITKVHNINPFLEMLADPTFATTVEALEISLVQITVNRKLLEKVMKTRAQADNCPTIRYLKLGPLLTFDLCLESRALKALRKFVDRVEVY